MLAINEQKKLLEQGVYFSIQAVLRCDSVYWIADNENGGVHLEKKSFCKAATSGEIVTWSPWKTKLFSSSKKKVAACASKQSSRKLEDKQYLDSSTQISIPDLHVPLFPYLLF